MKELNRSASTKKSPVNAANGMIRKVSSLFTLDAQTNGNAKPEWTVDHITLERGDSGLGFSIAGTFRDFPDESQLDASNSHIVSRSRRLPRLYILHALLLVS